VLTLELSVGKQVRDDVSMTTNDHILDLTQRALDEFDDKPLEVSVRRAVRIASLLGESQTAVRFSLELSPLGGHPQANAETTRKVMADAETWGDPSGPAELAMQEYVEDRKKEGDLILGQSLAEIDYWNQQAQLLPGQSVRPEVVEQQSLSHRIVETTRHRVFASLVAWERQLMFSATNERIFRRFQLGIDALLAERSPELLEQFNAVYRRLRDAAASLSTAPVHEDLSHAVTTCRRILKAVVDHVSPSDGRGATEDRYRIRLKEYVQRVIDSGTVKELTIAGVEGLYDRFATVDKLSNKGVHAQLALEEAELCAIHTYIVVGEVLRMPSADVAAPSA
jgi:hypothetical protein